MTELKTHKVDLTDAQEQFLEWWQRIEMMAPRPSYVMLKISDEGIALVGLSPATKEGFQFIDPASNSPPSYLG